MRFPGNQDEGGARPPAGGVLGHMWQRSRGTVSLWLVGVCSGLFVLITLLDLSGLVDGDRVIALFGLSYDGLFRRFRLHQLITAPLLHRGVFHVLFNMLSLWMLGPSVERKMGRGRYLVFSLVCGVSGMLGFLLVEGSSESVVLGYSGVIFGILVAQAIFFPDGVIAFFMIFPMKMKYAVLLLGAMELYFTITARGSGVAHAAHLFGALAALVWLLGGRTWRRFRGPRAAEDPRETAQPKLLPPRRRRRGKPKVPREL